jgi:hypothetical protein
MTNSNDKNREGLDIVRQVKSFQKELGARDLIRQFPTNQNVANNNGVHLMGFMVFLSILLLGGIFIAKSNKVESPATPTAATYAPSSVPMAPSNLGISPQ